jgi:hypothetical protein
MIKVSSRALALFALLPPGCGPSAMPTETLTRDQLVGKWTSTIPAGSGEGLGRCDDGTNEWFNPLACGFTLLAGSAPNQLFLSSAGSDPNCPHTLNCVVVLDGDTLVPIGECASDTDIAKACTGTTSGSVSTDTFKGTVFGGTLGQLEFADGQLTVRVPWQYEHRSAPCSGAAKVTHCSGSYAGPFKKS